MGRLKPKIVGERVVATEEKDTKVRRKKEISSPR
jgi:hypothetical protein